MYEQTRPHVRLDKSNFAHAIYGKGKFIKRKKKKKKVDLIPKSITKPRTFVLRSSTMIPFQLCMAKNITFAL